MDDLSRIVYLVFGGIVVVAIVSVIVGPRSQAPAALQAAGGVLSSIVSAAVNPVHTSLTNGNPALNPFSMPTTGQPSPFASWAQFGQGINQTILGGQSLPSGG